LLVSGVGWPVSGLQRWVVVGWVQGVVAVGVGLDVPVVVMDFVVTVPAHHHHVVDAGFSAL